MIKFKGIAWSLHPLFVLIMLTSVITGYFIELLTLFAIVFVHELGHVIAARGFGWTIREVKLLPFGGVAEVEDGGSMPSREEAIVALAGPLQNVWMGMAAWTMGQLGWWSADWSEYVWRANAMIGLFNLLPILPLDGGKLMHAWFTRTFTFHQSLMWGARISLVLSGGMVLVSIVPALQAEGEGIQANLLVVGLFLLITNWTYSRHVPFLFLRFLTNRGLAASKSMARGVWALPIVVSKRHSVAAILRLFKRDSYHLIVIMEDEGSILAILPEQQLVEGFLSDGKADRAVSELFM
ncbi:M50 family metallopeptidase [Paenibacillus oenotherae]|uniref:M50 family metallopeptidase n=1 Tax=Paenibacillus oenotherae TaxID=1435645 RepID=A0ABS7D8L7_9BACL|nr:M50 family metallopeptidase [Paenibacillus oenotherae]MBW7476221.1 M50 family metallopeptidase [Paenibacillus oenotherae]